MIPILGILIVIVVMVLLFMFLHAGTVLTRSIKKLKPFDKETQKQISDQIYKELFND